MFFLANDAGELHMLESAADAAALEFTPSMHVHA